MKTVLEKMKVKLQLDMLVSKIKRYFIVFYILFLYTGVYSMLENTELYVKFYRTEV